MLDNINLLVLAPYLNVQLFVDGVFIGAIFALASFGLALVWGVMNVKNLCQGECATGVGEQALRDGTPWTRVCYNCKW